MNSDRRIDHVTRAHRNRVAEAATLDHLAEVDWPRHRPAAPDAPIPGRNWFGGCDPDGPRVTPAGVCESCGELACALCGTGFYPDGGCECTLARPGFGDSVPQAAITAAYAAAYDARVSR